MAWTQGYYLIILGSMKKVLHALKLQGGQRIMDGYKFYQAEQSSNIEKTPSPKKNALRRPMESLSKGEAELSDRSPKRVRFDEIEIVRDKGRAKMREYQQEAEHYKNENKDKETFERFYEDFDTRIHHKDDIVQVSSQSYRYGSYKNKIDVKNGKIIEDGNVSWNPFNYNKLNVSDIIFDQMCLAMKWLGMKMSKFDLKYWNDPDIEDTDTLKVVKLLLPEKRDEDGSVKEEAKHFLAGTDEFIALAGTPTAQPKFYLLAQHPKALPGKEVTSITVKRAC
jgi:hypothetical protein